ncbi:hypothetical protein [Nocardia barduliensis]|uniref:hypothetical protein n=1 Tax=Nocardia barduliensis TaxID=2736643 RepID=UPI001571BDF3|nr:hypothetical protein [Nocardia barduliensis]
MPKDGLIFASYVVFDSDSAPLRGVYGYQKGAAAMQDGATPESGGGRDETALWTKVGGIAAVVSVVIAVLAFLVQCLPRSSPNGQSPPTSSPSLAAPSTTTADGDPAPEVQSSGTVRISSPRWGVAFHNPNWSGGPEGTSDVVVDAGFGLSAANASAFAVVTNPGYSACRAATYEVNSLTWEQLPSKTTVCVRSRDTRVGILQVIWKKNLNGEVSDITVTGVIWQPKR